MASGQFARRIHYDLEPLHRRLAAFNRSRRELTVETADWQQQLRQEHDLRVVEGHVIEAERERVAPLAAQAPTQPHELVVWLEALREPEAQQRHALLDFLARHANRADMSWFLVQELESEEALEDAFALAQLNLPWRPKLEVARCYWDEMGQGNASAMTSRVLENLRHELQVEVTHLPVWETVARANSLLGLVSNRRYTFQALGALAAIELTIGADAKLLGAGLQRLGFSLESCAYFDSRARLSRARSYAWNHDVILPLVAQDARCATALAEGALMRLASVKRCFERYSLELLPSPAHYSGL